MRRFWFGVALTVVVLLPTKGNAQVFQFKTPPPDVSAAAAGWQLDGNAIVVGGLTYFPTRGFRLFDGQVMSQTGMFEGVPVYSDTTIEPYSEIYVPLGSGRMRVYERKRERELAGTTGSHTPTFPVEPASAPVVPERVVGSTGDGAVGTGGVSVPRATDREPVRSARVRPRNVVMNAVSHGAPDGVWLEFAGARWYSDGAAVSFSPDRFVPMGDYHGFPVYREKDSDRGDIWVAVVADGPLAPYSKR